MNVNTFSTTKEMGVAAAKAGAAKLKEILATKGEANIILATGASQFETIEALLKEDIDWSKVTMFHLDEYIGLPITHPASFRKYLKERFVDKTNGLKAANYVEPDQDNPQATCDALGKLIAEHPIDVCFAGVGENAHLAFNDPPADFETEAAYIVVDLDEDCRKQQLGEGWFKSLDEVPKQAISMGIKQILKSKTIIISAPDERKAEAVKNSIEGKITPEVPSSILQKHADCHFYIDSASASKLSK